MPLSCGPTKFFAFSPIWWQVLHARKVDAPATGSPSAKAAPTETTSPRPDSAETDKRFKRYSSSSRSGATARGARQPIASRCARPHAGRLETKPLSACQGEPSPLTAAALCLKEARMAPNVKICGLSTPSTLEAALRAGADMVGFVFFPKSPRYVGFEAAHAPDLLQLHGQESAARVQAIRARFGRATMKAIGVAAPEDLATARAYDGVADMLLVDAKPP